MKIILKTTIILLFQLLSYQCFSQDKTTITTLDSSDVFYIGVDNPINVFVPYVDIKKVQIIVTGGTATPISYGKFNIIVSNGTEVIIKVTAKINGLDQGKGTFKFKIRKLPEPTASIKGKSGKDIVLTKTELLNIEGLNVAPINYNYTISSFTFSYTVSGAVKKVKNTGNKFNLNVIEAMNKLKAGQKVTFENIKAVGANKITRSLSPLVVKIVEK